MRAVLPLLALLLASCASFDTGGSVYVVSAGIPDLVQDVIDRDPPTREVFMRASKNLNYLVDQLDVNPYDVQTALEIVPGQTVETQTITAGVWAIYAQNYREATLHCTRLRPTMIPLLRAIADSLQPPSPPLHVRPTPSTYYP